ncbi:hypothetical protein HK105_200928 [Polyrhizophydium stewartii]|uniref:Uncharacterized protein n=1 Tax=Polyrhizophydium stewartii TaxID=2732419 RepID=A0ABR4NID8_9FUNG|nr:hypothetical protein HK105_006620 [Polyrhizophydium stewartii]
MSRPPPGGHSSISLGGDAPAPVRPSGRRGPAPSSIVFGDDSTPAPTPATPPRRSNHESSLVFGDDVSSAVDSTSPATARGAAASAPLVGSSRRPVTPTRAHPPGGQSSISLGSDDDRRAVSPSPSRRVATGILPTPEPGPLRTGRRIVGGGQHTSSIVFGQDSAEAAPAAEHHPHHHGAGKPSAFASSISFGDDESVFSAGSDDDNGGRRSRRPGRKQFVAEAHHQSKFHEFAGFSEPLQGKDEEDGKRIDPTQMAPAGQRSGKHGVY